MTQTILTEDLVYKAFEIYMSKDGVGRNLTPVHFDDKFMFINVLSGRGKGDTFKINALKLLGM